MHGASRRTLLHLHRFVKEAVFAVVDAARVHGTVAASARRPQPPYGGAYSGGPGSAAIPFGPPLSFAHAICACLPPATDRGGSSRGGIGHLEPMLVQALSQAHGSNRFIGAATNAAMLASVLSRVKQAANVEEYEVKPSHCDRDSMNWWGCPSSACLTLLLLSPCFCCRLWRWRLWPCFSWRWTISSGSLTPQFPA
jgi:hypothetical protein